MSPQFCEAFNDFRHIFDHPSKFGWDGNDDDKGGFRYLEKTRGEALARALLAEFPDAFGKLLTGVVAKMQCHGVESNRYVPNQPPIHKVQLGAVYGTSGENKDFADATPSGQCWMQISEGRPALAYFEPGKRYYVNFTEAPD